ncbi:hypothetical protein L6R52_16525 [Myxococcota bacterium]|nr:hypothetical protein [Myxococcota bacterium]
MNTTLRIATILFSLTAAAGCGDASLGADPGQEAHGLVPLELPEPIIADGCCDSAEAAIACNLGIEDYITRCEAEPNRPRGGGGSTPRVGPDGGAGTANPTACTGVQPVLDPNTGEVTYCELEEFIRNGMQTCVCVVP